MKVLKFIKLYLIVFPIAVLFGLWTIFCTVLDHIIDEYRIK